MKYIKQFILFESKKEPKYKIQKLKIGEFDALRGRNREANEHVTFELADDNDLWFHASGIQGSHLVIKVDGREVPDEVIQEAAKIVAKNSQTKQKEVEVIYCQRKFVKKPIIEVYVCSTNKEHEFKVPTTDLYCDICPKNTSKLYPEKRPAPLGTVKPDYSECEAITVSTD